ncbi:DUF5133 domain-containing protein [Streptomyces sp. NPDC007084]|uniref:DUF5133 domain-containing protein n=1 Tax=Streptomyces sp. NPDC007084 TaxID=3154313 RepID=UPI003453B150
MLMPLPATLQGLLTRYETLLAEQSAAPEAALGARVRDLEYTLCVSTGTREISEALETARAYLAATAATTATTPTGSGGCRRATAVTRREVIPASAERPGASRAAAAPVVVPPPVAATAGT